MLAGILTLALLADPVAAARIGAGGDTIRPIRAEAAPAVRLVHLRTGARHTLVLFDRAGQLRPAALGELRDFLTDPRSKIDHPIHWRLATLLVATAAHYPGRPLEVVSGYRHHNKHHNKSKHTRGRALDFRVKGVPNRELFETLRRSFVDVGVGYYPNSTFVHLDVRQQSALWVDYSGPGQTPCYSTTPRQDLQTGAADRLTYAEAQAAGCHKP
jgi:uncharacterized protein YcbK (DUF882 family)